MASKSSDGWVMPVARYGTFYVYELSPDFEAPPPPPLERLAQELDVDPAALRRYLRDEIGRRDRFDKGYVVKPPDARA